MVTLEFKSKLSEDPQILTLNNGVTTFIGGNGAGKSSILQAIFQKYIDNDDYRVICFSSGQNELFTELFNKHKNSNRRYIRERNEPIQSFYFNSEWIKLLIFFATIFKDDGLVREYLRSKNYIEVDEFYADTSSRLDFRFRIRKNYTQQIKNEISREGLASQNDSEVYEVGQNLMRQTEFHETLQKIVDVFEINFDFQNSENLVKRWLSFDSRKAYEVFPHKDIDKVFSFWALSTNGWLSNFELPEFNLRFNNGLEFKHLSDGEYQILSTYAIMDLFDNENTIFLFDEIDSHLYYTNLHKMWHLLNNSRGVIIATTHISESILQNKIENIKVIENGKVEDKLAFLELSKRLDTIVGKKNYQFNILSRVRFPVLMDNVNDWTIFRKLAVKKIGTEVEEVLDQILPIGKSSSFNNATEILGGAKLHFIDEFRRVNHDKEILTKDIFLVCDKDEFSSKSINPDLTVNFHETFKHLKKFNSNRTFTHLLCWRRREIENYLLSPTLLRVKSCLDAVNELYLLPELADGNNLDNITDIREGDFKDILRPLYNIEDSGFNEELLTETINHIPAEEISEDITNLYIFIKNRVYNGSHAI